MTMLRPWRLLLAGCADAGAVWLVLSRAEAQGMASLPVPWLTPRGARRDDRRGDRRWPMGQGLGDGHAPRRPPTALTAARIGGPPRPPPAGPGALLFGWYAGQAAVLASALVGERSGRFVVALVAVAGVGRACRRRGWLAQRWCRRPEDDEPARFVGLAAA